MQKNVLNDHFYVQKNVSLLTNYVQKNVLNNHFYVQKNVSNIMERLVLQRLKEWKERKDRKPLIVNGARQVGKTWALREFANRILTLREFYFLSALLSMLTLLLEIHL